MLFTLTHLNKGFVKLLISQYWSEGRNYQVWEDGAWVAMELWNIVNKEDYIKRNQDIIFDYLKSLSSQWDLLNLKKLASTDKKALNDLLNIIGLKTEILKVSEIVKKLEDYLKIKWHINLETKRNLDGLSQEINPSWKNPWTKIEESKNALDPKLQWDLDDINKKVEDDIIRNFDIKKPSKAQIVQIQEILSKRWYKLWTGWKLKNGIDWKFTWKTKNALLSEQKKLNATKSTEVTKWEDKDSKENQRVIEKWLENSLLLSYDPNIDKKDKEKTSKLQQVLSTRWYDLWKTGKNKNWVDGLFGEKTKKALNLELNKVKTNTVVDKKESDNSQIEWKPNNIKITAWFWESDYTKLRKNINNESFDNLIKWMSFEELKAFWQEIKDISEANYRKGSEYVYNWWNLSKITKIFEKRWYKADWVFGWIEVASLFELVESIYKSQLKINKSEK